MKYKNIVLIDNFDSFTFNLVDFFRQIGCRVNVFRNSVSTSFLKDFMAANRTELIVFSPGPSVPDKAGNMMKMIDEYHETIPMFGVCLGHEAFIEYFGGTLKFVDPVHGKSSPITHDGKGVFEGLPQEFFAGRYHSLCADMVPGVLQVSANYGDLVMGVRHKQLPIESVQFHPESVLSMKNGNGMKIIKNLIGVE